MRRSLATSVCWLALLPAVCAQAPGRSQPSRAGAMPVLPLTALDERALAPDLDNRIFTLADPQPLAVKELLLRLVRETSLSMIPDPAIGGTFIGELKNVTIRQALDAILPPLGLEYRVDGTVITVTKRAPETRLFDVNYITTTRATSARVGDANGSAAFANVTTTNATDLFADLAAGVRSLLSEHASFNIDRKAGVLQVTDFPERLDRVGLYLDTVLNRVHLQVQIEARVVELELGDESARTIDWAALTKAADPAASSGSAAKPGGLRVRDVGRFLTALAAQGKVSVVRDDRLTALNNEPSIVKTDRVTLSVTPQIAPEGVLMLSLTPVVAADGSSIVAADTLARVADGETVVVAGFGRDVETKERRNAGAAGGWFGRSTVVTRRHVEVLILLTPKMLTTASGQ